MSTDPSISQPSRSGAPALDGLVPRGAVESKRCSATRRNGQPCGRWAIVGGTVCPTHGGSAPQVREAANRRLESLVPRAIKVINELLRDPEVSPAVRLKAATEVLDRNGFKTPDEHVVIARDETAEEAALNARIAMALDVRSRETTPRDPAAEAPGNTADPAPVPTDLPTNEPGDQGPGPFDVATPAYIEIPWSGHED